MKYHQSYARKKFSPYRQPLLALCILALFAAAGGEMKVMLCFLKCHNIQVSRDIDEGNMSLRLRHGTDCERRPDCAKFISSALILSL